MITGRQAGRLAGQPVRAVGDLVAARDCTDLLHGRDAVARLAVRAHVMNAFRRVNVEATRLPVVILRPPLVYGPGVRANFAALVRIIRAGIPLPLGAVRNRRSLVYVGNLCDAIVCCLVHPGAVGETFLEEDGEAVSTPGLIRAVVRRGLIALGPGSGQRQDSPGLRVDPSTGSAVRAAGEFRTCWGWGRLTRSKTPDR